MHDYLRIYLKNSAQKAKKDQQNKDKRLEAAVKGKARGMCTYSVCVCVLSGPTFGQQTTAVNRNMGTTYLRQIVHHPSLDRHLARPRLRLHRLTSANCALRTPAIFLLVLRSKPGAGERIYFIIFTITVLTLHVPIAFYKPIPELIQVSYILCFISSRLPVQSSHTGHALQ